MTTRTFEITDYSHGYCHLFALVAAKILNKKISVVWDEEAWDEDGDVIEEPCLVHAYIEIDKGRLDAGGYDNDPHPIHDIYPCNEPATVLYSINDFEKIIAKKGWEEFIENEVDHIKHLIQAMLADANIDTQIDC